MSLSAVQEQFRTAMKQAGVEYAGDIIADGQLRRFRVQGDKGGSKNGWYVLHADGVPAGEFGCWKRGIQETWRANLDRELTRQEQEDVRRRLELMKQQRDEQLAARRADARCEASRIWAASHKADSEHRYLAAKGVKPHGLKQDREGRLVVPMRDGRGDLQGLQFIHGDGSKRFLPGTTKPGNYHSFGPKVTDRVAIAEGYATAATVHEATGWPLAVAFDVGNLQGVAEGLRERFPKAQILICGDNDRATEGNPGATRAREVAEAVSGLALIPEFKDDEAGSDWNDLAKLRGLEHVRSALLEGAKATVIAQVSKPAEKRLNGHAHPKPYFSRSDDGIWWHGVANDGGQLPPQWICPPLEVAAALRGIDQKGWGLLLEFRDADDFEHRWGMPARMLAGSGEEWRRELLDLGFIISTRPHVRNLLADFIQTSRPERHARCVERTGWHEKVFVMPERTLGDAEEEVIFQTETAATHVYRSSGTLEDWRHDVAELCRGNSRLLFAVSTAFAAILLHWAGEESGGFHLRGGTSSGKSTALRVAASVYGGPNYVHLWRATDNALESIASGHSDTLLILDELGQVDPHKAGEIAYMLANGSGKARSQKAGGARPVLTWRLIFLTSGEVSLADHMQAAGKRVHAGQETRLADIPADAGAGFGIFEQLRGAKGGAELARELAKAVKDQYGTAAPAFIKAVQPLLDTLPERLRGERDDFIRRYVPPDADGQVQRVASRFALVASAGEIATELGITGWDKGEAAAGALKCFQDWLIQRGGCGSLEPKRMRQQVRLFLEQHAKSRFERWGIDHDPGNYVIQNRAGFRRAELNAQGDSQELFYVLPEVFRQEICKGFSYLDVCKALVAAGCMKRDGTQYTRKERLPGMGGARCYVITPAIFKCDEDCDEADSEEEAA